MNFRRIMTSGAKQFLIGSICLTAVFLSACSVSSDKEWARHAIRQKIEQQALIVDVRTPEEYQRGHIKTAINIPHRDVKKRISEFGTDPARSIVVYCGIGGRAQYAKQSLEEEGFTNVWNLGGYSNLVGSQKDLIEWEK